MLRLKALATSVMSRKFWVASLALLALALLGGSIYALGQSSGDQGVLYLALINFNLILISLFFIYLGRRFVVLFLERKRGLVGARLHVRLLAIFSFLAVSPAIFVAVFSVIFLNLGIESWFSNRVTGALDGSLEVAQAYFEEHGNRLMSETRSLAADHTLRDPTFLLDTATLEDILRRERQNRNLAEVSLYSFDGDLIAHAGDLPPASRNELLQIFNQSKPESRLFADYEDGRIVAATPVANSGYLIMTRWVTPAVLNHLDRTRAAYQEYYDLRSEREKVRVVFTLFFVLLAVVILVGAMWSGFSLATRIVKPVTDLVGATNKVREGDLTARVKPEDDDEIGVLGQAFNQMTERLQENRDLLESKNRELDERRRTIEAVLTGVSAGVMNLDEEGVVKLANRSARDLFGLRIGGNISRHSEEIYKLVMEAIASEQEIMSRQVKMDKDGVTHTLLVRCVVQGRSGREQAVVVTFDDITTLISAQRVAAWADVAQRLAHEIKNPLTPIQLSAERLKRKYSEQIQEGKDIFLGLTKTIVDQVGDMRQMLNEFSDFARMPAAVFARVDVNEIIDELMLMQREARPDFSFKVDRPKEPQWISGDRAHLKRALTNIVENAVNAISEDVEKKSQGAIKIVVEKQQSGKITISVIDNGPGLPAEIETEKLFDPYVTTRKNGTGLGLSIVRKVVDEHQGAVRLIRRTPRGTRVEMTFPAYDNEENNNVV